MKKEKIEKKLTKILINYGQRILKQERDNKYEWKWTPKFWVNEILDLIETIKLEKYMKKEIEKEIKEINKILDRQEKRIKRLESYAQKNK